MFLARWALWRHIYVSYFLSFFLIALDKVWYGRRGVLYAVNATTLLKSSFPIFPGPRNSRTLPDLQPLWLALGPTPWRSWPLIGSEAWAPSASSSPVYTCTQVITGPSKPGQRCLCLTPGVLPTHQLPSCVSDLPVSHRYQHKGDWFYHSPWGGSTLLFQAGRLQVG